MIENVSFLCSLSFVDLETNDQHNNLPSHTGPQMSNSQSVHAGRSYTTSSQNKMSHQAVAAQPHIRLVEKIIVSPFQV